MPRRKKPLGQEKWTWEEIRLGRRLSKSEKRMRRIARNLGAEEDDNGKLTPPEEDSFAYWFFFIVFALIMLGVIIFASDGF